MTLGIVKRLQRDLKSLDIVRVMDTSQEPKALQRDGHCLDQVQGLEIERRGDRAGQGQTPGEGGRSTACHHQDPDNENLTGPDQGQTLEEGNERECTLDQDQGPGRD